MFLDQFKFAYQKHPALTWLIGVVFLLCFLCSYYDEKVHEVFQWSDPIISGMTLIISVLIFTNQVRAEWEDNLQKRISVYFEFEGRTVMKFENGVIPSNTDIRAWSLQIGQQLGKTQRLQFEPSIEMSATKIDWDKKVKCYFKLYPLTYTLTELPDFSVYKIKETDVPDKAERENRERAWKEDRIEYLKSGRSIEWHAHFDDRGKVKIDRIPND